MERCDAKRAWSQLLGGRAEDDLIDVHVVRLADRESCHPGEAVGRDADLADIDAVRGANAFVGDVLGSSVFTAPASNGLALWPFTAGGIWAIFGAAVPSRTRWWLAWAYAPQSVN